MQLYVHTNRLKYPVETALLTVRGLLDDTSTALSLMQLFKPIEEELAQRHSYNESRIISCVQCQHMLAYQHSVLLSPQSKQLDEELAVFRREHVDPFWKGYGPVRGHVRVMSAADAGPDVVVVEPQSWMLAQGNAASSAEGSAEVVNLFEFVDCKKRGAASALNAVGDCDENTQATTSKSRRGTGSASGEVALLCPQCGVECGYKRSRCLSLCLNFVLVDCFVLHKDRFRNKRLLNR